MPPKREKITATKIDGDSKLEKKAYDAIAACPLLNTLYQRSCLFYAETYSEKPGFSKSAYNNCFLKQVNQKHKSKALEKRLQYAATEAILEISKSFDNLIPMQKAMIISVAEKLAIEQGFKGIYFEAVPQIHSNEAIRTDGTQSVTRTDCYSLAQSVLHASFTKDHTSKPPVVSIPPNANAQSLLFHELSHAVDHLCTKHQSSKDVLNYIITHAQQSGVSITESSLSVDDGLNMTPLISSAMLIADPTEVLLREYTIITRRKERGYRDEAPEFLSDIKVNKDALDKDGILLGSSTSMEFLTFSLENIFAFMARDNFKKAYETYINDAINACRDRLERIHAIGQKTEQNKIIGHAIGIVAASMYEYTKVIIKDHEHEEFAKCLMGVPEILQEILSNECPGIKFPPIAIHKASSGSYVKTSTNLSSNSQMPNAQEGDSESEGEGKTTEPLKKRQKLTPSQNDSVLPQPQVTEEITPQNVHDNLNALFHNFNPTGVAKIDGDVLLFNSNCNTNGVSVSSPNWIAIPKANIASIQEIVSNNDDLETKRSSIVALINSQKYSSKHLRLSTKSDLQETTKTSKPNLKQILEHHYQSLDSQEKLQLEELTETITFSEEKSIQDSNDILLSPNSKPEQQSQSAKPKIHLLPESDHKIDHPNHIKNLLAHIDSLPTPQEGKTNNIIIVLERKQEGKNLGMPDVILLAELIKKEEKLNQEKLDELPPISLIPDNVRHSLIYQDALLYKAAEEKGIKVIGIDKAKISAQKKSDQEGYDPKGYNQEREAHMIEMLATISNSHPNHNIIFPVGASHIENISDALEAKSLIVNVNDNVTNQETVTKNSALTDVLNTELSTTAETLVALQQRMQKQSVSYKKPKKLEASTEENAEQENSGMQKSHVDKLTQKSTSEIPQPER